MTRFSGYFILHRRVAGIVLWRGVLEAEESYSIIHVQLAYAASYCIIHVQHSEYQQVRPARLAPKGASCVLDSKLAFLQ